MKGIGDSPEDTMGSLWWHLEVSLGSLSLNQEL